MQSLLKEFLVLCHFMPLLCHGPLQNCNLLRVHILELGDLLGMLDFQVGDRIEASAQVRLGHGLGHPLPVPALLPQACALSRVSRPEVGRHQIAPCALLKPQADSQHVCPATPRAPPARSLEAWAV